MKDLRDKIAEIYAREIGWWDLESDVYAPGCHIPSLELADKILALLSSLEEK